MIAILFGTEETARNPRLEFGWWDSSIICRRGDGKESAIRAGEIAVLLGAEEMARHAQFELGRQDDSTIWRRGMEQRHPSSELGRQDSNTIWPSGGRRMRS